MTSGLPCSALTTARVFMGPPWGVPCLPLAVAGAQQFQESAPLRHGDGTREIERGPAGAALDVGAAALGIDQVIVEEGVPARVEDAGRFLDYAWPAADVAQDVGNVVEQRGRTVRHGIPPSGRSILRRWTPSISSRRATLNFTRGWP